MAGPWLPYCHSPSALTEYLKQKLRLQRAKHLGRSLSAQVEPNVQPECNTIAIDYNISNGITPDEDNDNIFAAFEHSNCVYLLNLHLTLVLSSEWTFYGIGAIFTST